MMSYQTRLAAKALRQGGLIAHQTSTLAGIAADVYHAKAVRKAQRFKQRQAPFLLLADSLSTALQQAVYISPTLRKLAKTSWPGAVTLVFRAKQQLNPACYQKGYIAIRVDSDVQTRQLAKQCGGLMLSSSFNRKGQAVIPLHRQSRMRFHRYIQCVLPSQPSANGKASSIYKITAKTVLQLR